MKNWFLVSVAIVLLGFSTVYLVVKDSNSTNENSGLAPNPAVNCVNTKSESTVPYCTVGINRRYPETYIVGPICVKFLGRNTSPPPLNNFDFVLANDLGKCPAGYTLHEEYSVNIKSLENMYGLCAVARKLPGYGGSLKDIKDPPECAPDCLDRGILEKEDLGNAPDGTTNKCCSWYKERICIPQPS